MATATEGLSHSSSDDLMKSVLELAMEEGVTSKSLDEALHIILSIDAVDVRDQAILETMLPHVRKANLDDDLRIRVQGVFDLIFDDEARAEAYAEIGVVENPVDVP